MIRKTVLAVIAAGLLAVAAPNPASAGPGQAPSVLSIRDRAALTYRITAARLDTLLPRLMRETGFDMWIVSCNEDNLDPLFETMVPYENWNPITQILVFFDRGPAKGVERLNISRTDTQGLFQNAWDATAFDKKKGEGQWEALGRVVRERDPKRIGLNEGEVQWLAGGLTVVLKKRIVDAVGPKYASRLQSAEPLATLWAETLVDDEVELMERTAALSRSIIADMFSSKVVTVGLTTVDDLRWYYWQRAADLGLKVSFSPFVSRRGRSPKDAEKWGKDDKVIRPGDLLHCDVGIKYMRWNSDHQEMAYVLRPGETDAPESFRKLLAECNRLQDVYCGEFRTGLTGNQILGNILGKAGELGIPGPRVYSHSMGLFLHEPGPLIGLPWEQVNNAGRGDVKLVPMSTFTAEMSVTGPVAEWGVDFRVPLEMDILFDGGKAVILAGRQTSFHLIR
ncbi:MAG TPA: M24 family metallopeptidase [Candidatus Aminicenantes bacterium]|nr:M24 family metallopeptidase [Candidatus Aminicenantes bacterium]HRY63842.1 M24 family metallopeptidase [Candidatus Aminicenantes bacterium]HRZ70755.1 M24 family metallopeptidase [Candidatus Aminicenantes bacterium]